MADFQKFRKQVESEGLTAHDHGNGHWRITGGDYGVNFYPRTGTVYINGVTHGLHGTIGDAIRFTNTGGLGKRIAKVRRKKTYAGVKRKLLRRDPHCRWCGTELEEETATIEHLIPISRGGTNGGDNLRLACQPCNKERRNEMPDQTERRLAAHD